MNTFKDTEAVTVGIDAAVTANHHVVVRRPEPGGVGVVVDEFTVPPTLDGLAQLRKRLAAREVRVAVAEPTSMTWLGLSIVLGEAGIDLALLGSRHVARLRGAVSGKNKSDVIDAQLLSRAGELFDLQPAVLPDAATLALQRACRRRHKLLMASNRCWRRIVALGRWAFPDTWNALRGSRAAILAVLRRWPHLEALSRARLTSIADEVAAHSRAVSDDLDARVAGAGGQAMRWWQTLWVSFELQGDSSQQRNLPLMLLPPVRQDWMRATFGKCRPCQVRPLLQREITPTLRSGVQGVSPIAREVTCSMTRPSW